LITKNGPLQLLLNNFYISIKNYYIHRNLGPQRNYEESVTCSCYIIAAIKKPIMNNKTKFLVIAVGIVVSVAAVAGTTQQSANGKAFLPSIFAKAPMAISGDNIYIAWWTNKTANGNNEVMLRVSNDAGATFGDKINLSNTTSADSVDADISSEDGNVAVTWWERNQTANEPAVRISTDNELTFGPPLKLAANGTIGETAEEGE
jgi:hypothetical protein